MPIIQFAIIAAAVATGTLAGIAAAAFFFLKMFWDCLEKDDRED